jgi:DNA-binding NarL/FixJ family response regulator
VITVAVADDQQLIRSAVVALLAAEPDIHVVGEAADGRAAMELVREHRPDIVLMDLMMPVMDGVAATAAICADPALRRTRVLVLTTFEDDDNVLAALRAGAGGFVGKGSDLAQILAGVRAVHAGEPLLSPRATDTVIRQALNGTMLNVRPAAAAAVGRLTDREREILGLVGRGRSNAEIAHVFVISEATVKTHVNRTMTKVGAHDRAQLVVLAYESGLIAPGSAPTPDGR